MTSIWRHRFVLLRPGGGDPLALVQLAIAKIREDERKRGAFSIKAVLLDQDKLGQAPERDRLLYAEAAQSDLQLIWQGPSHEALLLRHLPGCHNLRPGTTLLAGQELVRRWPEYRKPMSAMRLASRIRFEEVAAACMVEPSLCDFVRRCGLSRKSNACRIAAHRLRNSQYLNANTIPIREQVRDSVEFVRLVWEAIEQSLREEDP